jgi:hypothetical protein
VSFSKNDAHYTRKHQQVEDEMEARVIQIEEDALSCM